MKKILAIIITALFCVTPYIKADEDEDVRVALALAAAAKKETKENSFGGKTSTTSVGNGTKVKIFGAEWCGPCKRLHAAIDNGEFADALNGAEVQFIDADQSPNVCRAYNVTSYPTVVIVNSDNREIDRTVGFNKDNKDAFADFLKKHTGNKIVRTESKIDQKYFDAYKESMNTNKLLVVWVECYNRSIVDQLPDCIHVRLESFPEVKVQAVIVGQPVDGTMVRYDLDFEGVTADKIKSIGQKVSSTTPVSSFMGGCSSCGNARSSMSGGSCSSGNCSSGGFGIISSGSGSCSSCR